MWLKGFDFDFEPAYIGIQIDNYAKLHIYVYWTVYKNVVPAYL